MIRRISLLGGPGCGKSTTASWIYSQLKMDGKDVELIREWVKKWAYMGVQIDSFDQLLIFSQQLREEELVLKSGVDLVITDSPVFLPVCYSIKYKFREWEALAKISKYFDETYPSINIFLTREGIEYVDEGRYETKDEAIAVDNLILSYMDKVGVNYIKMPAMQKERILEYVKREIK
jgi:thymidylate kinase